MKKVFIIAEAGVNHNGSLETAKKMIDIAKSCKVDCIKFQTFKAESVVSKSLDKAAYQKMRTNNNESQLEMIKKLELSKEDHFEILNYCKEKEIDFMSSPFDIDSFHFLMELGLTRVKLGSGELTNLPILREIARSGCDLIMSTGMATLAEVSDSINFLLSEGVDKNKISLLHANTDYPTVFKDVNLLAMNTLRKTFEVNVGYSDHTLGIDVSVAAVSLGATIIEKHFTLDTLMEGPDHAASLDPEGLSRLVTSIRNIELALGSSEKKPSESELRNIQFARKSIVAKKNITRGEVFSTENITTKRPGNGISPMRWDQVIGMPANRDYSLDELIECNFVDKEK